MTERIFDIIKDPNIIEKENAKEQVQNGFAKIHEILNETDKHVHVFNKRDNMSLHISDIIYRMHQVLKHLDEEFEDDVE